METTIEPPRSGASDRATRARRALLGLATLAVAILLVRLGGFDLAAAEEVLARTGTKSFAALVPFAFLLVVEAAAWSLSLGVPLGPTMLGRLVQGRLAIEAISLTVPGSILASDGVAPLVFARSAGVPRSTAVAGVAVKKWGILLGHVLALGLAALVGGRFFTRVAADGSLGFEPRPAIGAASLILAIVCLVLTSQLSAGAAERIRTTLGRIPLASIRRLMDRAAAGTSRIDALASAFFGGPRRRIASLVLVSTGVWVAEALEVFVLLHLLGTAPDFADVLAMEALLTIVRSIAFFSPGGLGAQELAYLVLVPLLLGVPGTGIASGFVVLRRARDLLTIALGYASFTNRVVLR